MAENNPLDPDFDDTMALPFDDDGSNPSSSGKSSNLSTAFASIFSAIRQNRLYQFLIVLVIGAILTFYFFGNNQPPKPYYSNDTSAVNAPPILDTSIVPKKSVSKKKKKVKYVDVYRQLEASQIGSILRELSYKGIAYNLVQNGKQFDLQVDRNQVTEAKYLLAIKGLPASGATGYEIFDSASNLGVTEFDKRIRLVRALSGEMERSIMQFDVVDYAYVEIVIPEKRLFSSEQPPVTSSILIKRKSGMGIDDQTIYAIIQLVTNSVEGLLPKNISVVDTEGRVLSTGVIDRIRKKEKNQTTTPIAVRGNGTAVVPEMGDVVQWFQVKLNYESALEQKAMRQLSGILPEGSYKVAVTVDLDSVSTTGVPNVRQIVTSIVVHDQHSSINLDQSSDTIDQIKSVVAGSVGYVKNRDRVYINRGTFSDQPTQDVPVVTDTVDSRPFPAPLSYSLLTRFVDTLRLWPILVLGMVVTSVIGSVIWIVQIGVRRLRRRSNHLASTQGNLAIDSENLSDHESMNAAFVKTISGKSDFSKVVQLKSASVDDLDIVTEQLKKMIQGNEYEPTT